MVTAKLSQMSKAEAAAYLGRHSTRYMLREAGVPDAEVAEARAILEVKDMTGSVVPLATALAVASDPMFLDESAALAAAAFPISEPALIEKAKAFLYCVLLIPLLLALHH